MHEHLFSNSAFAEGASVLNLALRPYSIGHEILLHKISNPLATYSRESLKELPEDVQRGKLFSAVFICARTWKQNHARITWPRLTMLFRMHLETAVEVEKFQQYRAIGCADFPMVKMPRVKGAPYHYFGAPEAARLLMFAQQNELQRLCAADTAFDVPMAFARMLYLAHLETEGAVWVENYHDRETQVRQEEWKKSNPENTFSVGEDAVQAASEKWNAAHPECPVPLIRPSGGSDA